MCKNPIFGAHRGATHVVAPERPHGPPRRPDFFTPSQPFPIGGGEAEGHSSFLQFGDRLAKIT